VPLSTTGNFLALSLQEKKEVAETFVKAAEGLFPVVVGCNHIRMAEIVELARFAQDLGALAIMVCPPFYWKATDEQIVAHYDEICSAIDIGVILYNNHWASQVDLSVETIDRILENENVVGLKESTHSIFKAAQVHRRFKDRLNIFNGLGEAHEPMFTHLGSRGFTSVLGNAVPQTAAKMHHLLENKRFDDTRRLAQEITPLSDCMDALSGGQYIAALKYGLHRQGICGQTERKPVVALSQPVTNELDRLLDAGLKL
jgi:4-hydroxy-tetrahydrodipicolinate synthase